jgi:methionyl aminopeptidase
MVVLRTRDEIEKMKRPNQVVAKILNELVGLCRPGVSTFELEEKSRELVEKYKVKSAFYQYRGYPDYLCASLNEEVVHGIPSKQKVLKEGDIISLDFGVIDNGFYGDAALTAPVGKISDALKKLLAVGSEALGRAIEQCRPGNYLSDIARAVQTAAEDNGFSVVRDFVGHGIGRNLHEDPQVPNFGIPKPNVRLREGMVLALEPMLNMGTWRVKILDDGWTVVTEDGQPSAHFEHTVAVTGNGPLVLSRAN